MSTANVGQRIKTNSISLSLETPGAATQITLDAGLNVSGVSPDYSLSTIRCTHHRHSKTSLNLELKPYEPVWLS